jgi:hypothetical protein
VIALILAALALILVPAATPQNSRGIVEGTVFRNGTTEPLPSVVVTLTPQDAEPYSTQTVTDGRGRFVFRDLLPGKYVVSARRSGYLKPAAGFETSESTTILVAPGQHVENVSLALAPGGVVTGTILDDRGKPLANIGVSVKTIGRPETGGLVETDDRGMYRIYGLPAGIYLVSGGVRTSRFAETYYPGVTDSAEAEPIIVAEGSTSRIDISLKPVDKVTTSTFKISGRLVGLEEKLEGLRISDIYVVPRFGKPKATPEHSNGGLLATGHISQVSTGGPGFLDFATRPQAVPPGSYELFIEVGNAKDMKNCCDIVGRTPVNVVNQDVEGITVTAGGVDVRGQVTVAGKAASISALSIALALVPEDVRSRQVKPDEKGNFTIPGVMNGVWKVLVGVPENLALLDVRHNDASVYQKGFTIEDRTPPPIQVIVSPAGELEGSIRTEQGQPGSNATVILVDSSTPANTALFKKASADGNGRFSMASLAPGAYRVWALDPVAFRSSSIPSDPAAWPAFLAPFETQGTSISISAGGGAAVELTLVRPSVR